MRRKDREITNLAEIDQIIAKAQVCRLGLCKDNRPYIVPVSFGYDGSAIFFHTAPEGMKIDYLLHNNQVCFEVEHDVRIVAHETKACNWSHAYSSVIGFGKVYEIVETSQKREALNQIMRHYSERSWDFDENMLARTRVWRIEIESLSGKRS